MVVGVLTTSYPRFAGDGAGSFVADDVTTRNGQPADNFLNLAFLRADFR